MFPTPNPRHQAKGYPPCNNTNTSISQLEPSKVINTNSHPEPINKLDIMSTGNLKCSLNLNDISIYMKSLSIIINIFNKSIKNIKRVWIRSCNPNINSLKSFAPTSRMKDRPLSNTSTKGPLTTMPPKVWLDRSIKTFKMPNNFLRLLTNKDIRGGLIKVAWLEINYLTKDLRRSSLNPQSRACIKTIWMRPNLANPTATRDATLRR